jgi:protein TonB
MIAGAIYCGPGFADEKDNPHSSVATAPSNLKPVLLSEEVAAGFLIQKVDPEYPRLARAARVSGIVTLHAIISKAGDITNLNAICGPQILQEASLKAVQKWKYRPYIMHGEPFEVETTIRVTFTLGDKKKLKFSKDTCPD